jgi:biotin carboxyl carrier protein
VSGEVVEVAVEPGAQVAEGTPLVHIRTEEA